MLLRWVVAYLLIIAVWAVIIVRRPGPTLWKGSSIVVLNLLFVLAITASIIWRGNTVTDGGGNTYWCCLSPGLLVFALMLILIAVLLRKTWVLLRIGEADSIVVLERCFTQTRSSPRRVDDGYAVRCGEEEMRVRILPNVMMSLGGVLIRLPGRRVRFVGVGKSKKAALIRSLFTKQFHASVPTPRFRA